MARDYPARAQGMPDSSTSPRGARVIVAGPMPRHDAVIVGGGHNGLVAAAYLARAGRSVLVLERRAHARRRRGLRAPVAGRRRAPVALLLPRLPAARRRIVARARAARSSCAGGRSRPTRRGRRAAACSCAPRRRADTRRRWRDVLRDDRRAWRARVFPTLTRAAAEPRGAARAVADDAAWEALFERPLGEAIEATFADDLVRGIVLTDALIGTFAAAHDPSLRQNRCFLYHVIGNGDGRLGRAGRRHGRAHRRAGAARRGRPAPRSAHGGGGDARSTPTATVRGRRRRHRGRRGHVLATVAPAVARPAARRGAGARAAGRGRPAEGQHAADPAAAAARSPPSTRARRSPAPSTSTRATRSSQAAYAQAAPRRAPRAAAVRDLLPLAHRPVDPRRPSCGPRAPTR